MDVSNHQLASHETLDGHDVPGGEQLIETVVSLTGLPGSPVKEELDSIIESAGQEAKRLTLAELRVAMMAYLESIHEEFLAQESQDSDGSECDDSGCTDSSEPFKGSN